MTIFKEVHRLSLYEECVGMLRELVDQDGVLVALIGKIHLSLPSDLEPRLRPLVGRRISILHTDIPKKPYLFQVFAEEPNHVENDMEGG